MADETRIVIFTDLDGTLLDSRSYSFADALPALRLIKKRSVPLVICSSKTAAEIEHYRRKLDNTDPFVSENGGGLFVPEGYFDFRVADWASRRNEPVGPSYIVGGYEVLRLGARYEDLRIAVETLRREGFQIKGFGDMTAEEIAGLTGLTLDEARMARQRDFDEPFVIEGDKTEAPPIERAIEDLGLHYTMGRMGHLLGNSDKGKAVSVLTAMYRDSGGEVTTIAIGDAPNDLQMLRVVDHPVVVQQPDGFYATGIGVPGLIKAPDKGPAGWNLTVTELLNHFQ